MFYRMGWVGGAVSQRRISSCAYRDHGKQKQNRYFARRMSEERKVKLPAELLGLQPQEEALEVMVQPSKIYIGVPRERHFQENRISLTPEAVSLLVNRGARVVVETKAGDAAHIYDTDYSEAGAEIAYSPEDVFKADIILKSAPPTDEEIEMMTHNQVLMSPIHLPTVQEENLQK